MLATVATTDSLVTNFAYFMHGVCTWHEPETPETADKVADYGRVPAYENNFHAPLIPAMAGLQRGAAVIIRGLYDAAMTGGFTRIYSCKKITDAQRLANYKLRVLEQIKYHVQADALRQMAHSGSGKRRVSNRERQRFWNTHPDLALQALDVLERIPKEIGIPKAAKRLLLAKLVQKAGLSDMYKPEYATGFKAHQAHRRFYERKLNEQQAR